MHTERRSIVELKFITVCIGVGLLLQACHEPVPTQLPKSSPSYDLKEESGRIEHLDLVEYSLYDALLLIQRHLGVEVIYGEHAEAESKRLILNAVIQPMTWRDALISLVTVNGFKLEQTSPNTFVIYPPESSHETKLPEEFHPVPILAN